MTQVSDARESVTCPECGHVAEVTLNKRDSVDFCPQCDFPLFWTPAQIVLGDGARADESLRRLPGTGGRVTVASVPCPHCSESNSLSAITCVRCGLPMALAPEPPPPPPPAPAPAPVVVPQQGVPLWLWVLLGITAAMVLALVVWALLER